MTLPHHRIFVFIALLLSAGTAPGDSYLSPDSIDGSTKIDAETLIKLAREHNDLVIIDSRIRSDLRQGFITGAISLPDTETRCETLARIIPRMDTPVVFYCNGPKCRRSDRAVMIARDCGYRDIYWFRGGFEEWLDKKYMISK